MHAATLAHTYLGAGAGGLGCVLGSTGATVDMHAPILSTTPSTDRAFSLLFALQLLLISERKKKEIEKKPDDASLISLLHPRSSTWFRPSFTPRRTRMALWAVPPAGRHGRASTFVLLYVSLPPSHAALSRPGPQHLLPPCDQGCLTQFG
jgi:hypothetical protein